MFSIVGNSGVVAGDDEHDGDNVNGGVGECESASRGRSGSGRLWRLYTPIFGHVGSGRRRGREI